MAKANGNDVITRDVSPATLAGFENRPVESVADRDAGAAAAVAREEAEIKSAIFLARQFPRNEHAAYTRIMKSCTRPGFAENARYSFPRGSQTVSGPSVQLAREIARCWGNIRFGLRVVSMDEDTVHIRGYAHDLETNAYVEAEDKFAKLVQRKQRGGGTAWVKPDERDLRELINRRGAILVRNCILQVVPSDVVDDAERQVIETVRKAAQGEIEQSRDEAIRRLVRAFDDIGVSAEALEKYLKHPLSAITADEIADLRAVYKSIIDGNSRREEYFDLNAHRTAQTESNQELNERLKSAEKGQEPEQSPLLGDES